MRPVLLLLASSLSIFGQDAPRKARPVAAFTWEWAFEDDLSEEELESKKKVIEAWHSHLWAAGEGNFAIARMTIRDRSRGSGTFRTPAGLKDASMLNAKVWAKTHPGSHMVIPGSCDPFTWLHELGHLLFRCPEEYDSPGGCPCVQSTGAKGGKMQWCDARTHSREQAAQHPPCWEGYILKAYPRARHPGPGGETPAVQIDVRNN